MKKTYFKTASLIICLVLAFAFSGCDKSGITPQNGGDAGQGSSGKINYEEIIESFVPDKLNTTEMEVGDEDKPTSAVWLQQNGSNAEIYCDNEDVVTVTKLGKVTAVGFGTAHVIISSGGMWDIHRYNVTEPASEADLSKLPSVPGVDFAYEIQTFAETELNTFSIKIGEKHAPTASVWASTGGINCYSSDESVATAASNATVTGVGKGTAYVLVCAPIGNMHTLYKYVVTE